MTAVQQNARHVQTTVGVAAPDAVVGEMLTVLRCYAQEAFPPGVRMDELCVVRRWYTPEYYTHWQYCLQRPPGDLPSNAWGRQERYDLGNLGHRLLHVAFDQLYDSPSVLVITPLIEVRTRQRNLTHVKS
jgi:hypothetical protein